MMNRNDFDRWYAENGGDAFVAPAYEYWDKHEPRPLWRRLKIVPVLAFFLAIAVFNLFTQVSFAALTQSASFSAASSQYLYLNGIMGTTAGSTITEEGWINLSSLPASGGTYDFVHVGAYATSPYILYYIGYSNSGGTYTLTFHRDKVCIAGASISYTVT
ncbi:MAG: hypothetical protein HIU89_18100, partial [Proteobacteria bacterium]|nr:hypothetical protein [Pseudomonadota bacterium]